VQLRAGLPPDRLAMIQAQQAYQIWKSLRTPLYTDWFDFNDVTARTGFKDDTRRGGGDSEG